LEPAVQPVPEFFSLSSFWNAPLASNAPLDQASASLSDDLQSLVDAEVAGKWGPWISTTGYSTPIYIVPANQPTVYVREENANPSQTLQTAFDAVPLPSAALPSSGSDAELTVWQPSSDRLWEFWGMKHEADGWNARWGGAMEHVSQSQGYFSPSSWPGAQYNWGATATSLPLVGGLITLQDLRRGEIDHALALALPVTRAGTWSWPAQRSDGIASSPTAIAQGTRFRLDPSVDVTSLRLPPLVQMMALAAQRYGIVVRDTSGVVDFYGEDPTPTGANPWKTMFGGQAVWQLMSRFPWANLQALALTSCSNRPCPEPAG
jgi:hypothetical protein